MFKHRNTFSIRFLNFLSSALSYLHFLVQLMPYWLHHKASFFNNQNCLSSLSFRGCTYITLIIITQQLRFFCLAMAISSFVWQRFVVFSWEKELTFPSSCKSSWNMLPACLLPPTAFACCYFLQPAFFQTKAIFSAFFLICSKLLQKERTEQTWAWLRKTAPVCTAW